VGERGVSLRDMILRSMKIDAVLKKSQPLRI
jgi:hypothetical protein